MRITNAAQLSQLKSANKVSSAAAAQIEAALKQSTAGSAEDAGSLKSSISHHRRSVKSGERGESKGEASVRLALVSAFGDWNAGGEVVQELIPFSTRAFRADFALPRWKLCLAVDGWSFHGMKKEDHHRDRERGNFFAMHNWLLFRVSHGQALKETGTLVDGIAHAMTLRDPFPREAIELEPKPHKHGVWYKLHLKP